MYKKENVNTAWEYIKYWMSNFELAVSKYGIELFELGLRPFKKNMLRRISFN
jgi:hypothetical protein